MNQPMERAGKFLPRIDETGYSNEVDRRVVTLTDPASSAAEQYRTLYFRLERMRELRPMKVVAVTSALPGEGKTVTAANLALASARANPDRRILLVDADLRCGSMSDYLGIKSKPGLSDLVSGQCEIRDAVRRFRHTSLAVITSGAHREDPTHVLASPRMKQLLKGLRESFYEVYIDLPPALPFADASIVGNQADGVVLVIRAHVTSSKRANQAIEHLSGAPVIGCVLNGAELRAVPYLQGYNR